MSLEELEGRIVPTSYVVDNLGDAGQGANNTGDLRYCINQLNATGQASNTIVFMKGAQPLFGTISLQSGLPSINKNVSINGPGASNLTIQGNASANNQYGVVAINGGAIVTISGLTITGGYSGGNGGGIYNLGSLTLSNDVISNNTSLSNGGGVDNGLGSSLTLNNDTIQYNTAKNGGGIANFGSLGNGAGGTIAINNNKATGNGGGIDNESQVDFTNTVNITYNAGSGNGGGVYNNLRDSFWMQDGTISNNNANYGGGVYNSGTITMYDLTVGANQANQGGGLYLASSSTTSFNNVTVSGNQLVGAGAVAKGVGYITGATIEGSSLIDDDDPNGQPVKIS